MARLKEPDRLPIEAKRTKDRIEKNSARRPTKQCLKCGGRCFHRHRRRRRWFLPVIEWIVWPIRCWLYHWRCVNCGTTFTHLPAECAPFKRYLRAEIEGRARRYVDIEPMSYRRVVTERGAAVVYDDPIAGAESTEAEKEAEVARALAPSTPHRWISALAACREPWQPAVRAARQLHQGALLNSILISAAKYRSQARKRALEACGLLLRALSILARANPTQLATLGSSP
jgi:hypothetical protein